MRMIQKQVCAMQLIFLVASFMLAACTPGETVPPAVQPSQASSPTVVPTAVPLKTLVICLGEEPKSLYLYDNPTASAWSVLEALDDGPIDTVNYEPHPVILEALPTQENGGIKLQSVSVSAGDLVANTEGDIVALAKGTRVFPEGCASGDCAVEWDGTSELSVAQMTATFKLMAGLKWSDGSALTADDSVYSFAVASDPATSSSKNLVNKTAAYTAADTQTVEWTGKPGYLTQNPAAFFFIPLPRHQLSPMSAAELMTSSLTARNPLGWGAYAVDEWVAGDHIRLVKNPYYFRAAEGLPHFDVLVYRFLGSKSATGLSPLTSGECDIIDSSVDLEGQIQSALDLQKSGSIKAYFGQGPEWELLNFGIKPASYDDAYNPFTDRPDYFGDVRTRQAVAYCIDRSQMNTNFFLNQSSVPATYLPPGHPYSAKGLTALAYDPQKGMALLDEVGWKDTDGDLKTPREAVGVSNVLDGTAFSVSYTAAESDLHRSVADSVAASLRSCGIEVKVSLAPVDAVYAAAPAGSVFGRNFDLAEFAWSVGRFPPCYLYSSSEIPSAKNSWLGTKYGGVNFSGYSNPEYDKACSSLLSAGLSAENFNTANQTTQQILSDDLPVVPLFYHVHLLVTQTDLCGVSLDVSSRSGIKDIEQFDSSNTCN